MASDDIPRARHQDSAYPMPLANRTASQRERRQLDALDRRGPDNQQDRLRQLLKEMSQGEDPRRRALASSALRTTFPTTSFEPSSFSVSPPPRCLEPISPPPREDYQTQRDIHRFRKLISHLTHTIDRVTATHSIITLLHASAGS